jgi:hypothetical protein
MGRLEGTELQTGRDARGSSRALMERTNERFSQDKLASRPKLEHEASVLNTIPQRRVMNNMLNDLSQAIVN